MKILLQLALATLVSVSSICEAADWQLVSISTDGARTFIDGSSIASAAKYKKAWVRRDYPTVQETSDYPAKKYQSVIQLVYFDCKEKSMAAVQLVYYSDPEGRGEVIYSGDRAFSPDLLSEQVPGSVGEGQLKAACGTHEYRAQKHRMLSTE